MARASAGRRVVARRSQGAPPASGRRSWRRWLLLGGLLFAGYVAWDIASLPGEEQVAKLRTTAVRETPLMKVRVEEAADEGRKLKPRQTWVEYNQISPAMIKAVVASEDARFFAHKGIDFQEIQNAVHDTVSEGRKLRGASTLTQQVAKNLYLSGDRSLVRKAKEAVLADRLESTLSKRRILTLYLNIAEWGDGIFGIEAAARAYLRKSARQITIGEAAGLAAMLPNPRKLRPGSKALRRRALHVLERMQQEGYATAEEAGAARADIAAWLGSDS